jgi:hypothetical protein
MHQPLRKSLIRSAELVFGPGKVRDNEAEAKLELTNGANDGCATKVLCRFVLGIELAKPLDSRATGIQMIQSVCHGDSRFNCKREER